MKKMRAFEKEIDGIFVLVKFSDSYKMPILINVEVSSGNYKADCALSEVNTVAVTMVKKIKAEIEREKTLREALGEGWKEVEVPDEVESLNIKALGH